MGVGKERTYALLALAVRKTLSMRKSVNLICPIITVGE